MSYGRTPPNIEGMVSLKVDNLTYRTNMDDLRRVFEKFGEVGDVYIPRDRFTRESRGFAFIRYCDKRDAEDAMDEMDGTVLDGREIRVQTARYGRPAEAYRKPARGSRYGGGGRYGSSRSGYRERDRSDRRRSRSRSRSRSRGKRHRSYSRSRSRSRSRSYRTRSRSASRSRSRSNRRSPTPRNSHSRSRSPPPPHNDRSRSP